MNCALSWYFEKSTLWCTVRETSNYVLYASAF